MSFDKDAKNWDKDIKKVERAEIFAKAITDFIKPDSSMEALEFGSGTGLLSVALKENFQKITLVDSSQGMIEMLQEKIIRDKLNNFKPILSNNLEDGLTKNSFDVIYILMTLHHMVDLDRILQLFNSSLKDNGYLCIADLVKEDGSFHADSSTFNGHNGFDKDKLSAILLKNGLQMEYYKICAEAERALDGKIKKYPLFLMIAKKRIY